MPVDKYSESHLTYTDDGLYVIHHYESSGISDHSWFTVHCQFCKHMVMHSEDHMEEYEHEALMFEHTNGYCVSQENVREEPDYEPDYDPDAWMRAERTYEKYLDAPWGD